MRNHLSGLSLLILVMLVSSLNAQGLAQKYAEGKLFLANGMNIEGKNLRMTMESATIEIMGQDQTFMLADIVQVMAKKGKGKSYGKICAASCVAINLLSYLAGPVTTIDENGNEVTTEQDPGSFLIGAALLGGISYGIGYLAGQVNDDWEIVYLNRN